METKEKICNKLIEFEYWAEKITVFFERLDEIKKQGLQKDVAKYLLEVK